MRSYEIHHGMDDQRTQPLGLAIFNDEGILVRVDQPIEEGLFDDAIRDADTVQRLAGRFKSFTFTPTGATT